MSKYEEAIDFFSTRLMDCGSFLILSICKGVFKQVVPCCHFVGVVVVVDVEVQREHTEMRLSRPRH